MYCQVCFEEFYLEYFSIEQLRHLSEYFVPLRNTGYYDGFSSDDSKKNRLEFRRFSMREKFKITANEKQNLRIELQRKKLKLLNTPD